MHKLSLSFSLVILLTGCSLLPDVSHEPRLHNPFPQLHRIAVLPFFNQSAEPTVDGEQVAQLYYAELQQVPGFEVLPVGVAKNAWLAKEAKNVRLDREAEPPTARDFQEFAQDLGVDAIVIGSITEYTPYYPPRMGLAVRWYAANASFHEMPPGYGLPWGTAAEEYIPDDLVFEAEFALAKEQLKTQTPDCKLLRDAAYSEVRPAKSETTESTESSEPESLPIPSLAGKLPSALTQSATAPDLPTDWPDPRGFVPPVPSGERPPCEPHFGPVMSHVHSYDGHNADFTQALAGYYYFRDDARFGGWQAYLQRSDDFIRFCCHMHISEMLSARGGAGKTRVVWRWPIGRYER